MSHDHKPTRSEPPETVAELCQYVWITQEYQTEKMGKILQDLHGNGRPGLIREMEQIKVKVAINSWVGKALALTLLGLLAAGVKIHYSNADPVIILPAPTSQSSSH